MTNTWISKPHDIFDATQTSFIKSTLDTFFIYEVLKPPSFPPWILPTDPSPTKNIIIPPPSLHLPSLPYKRFTAFAFDPLPLPWRCVSGTALNNNIHLSFFGAFFWFEGFCNTGKWGTLSFVCVYRWFPISNYRLGSLSSLNKKQQAGAAGAALLSQSFCPSSPWSPTGVFQKSWNFWMHPTFFGFCCLFSMGGSHFWTSIGQNIEYFTYLNDQNYVWYVETHCQKLGNTTFPKTETFSA